MCAFLCLQFFCFHPFFVPTSLTFDVRLFGFACSFLSLLSLVFIVVCSMIPVLMYRALHGVEVGIRRIILMILSRIRFSSVYSLFVGFLVSPV